MKVLIALALIFSAKLQAQPSTPGAAAVEILHLSRAKKVLLIGKFLTETPEIEHVLNTLLAVVILEADWIGFEIPSNQQPALDRYLAGDRDPRDDWSPGFIQFLGNVRALNRARRTGHGKTVRVLALDLPLESRMDERRWFIERNDHMMMTLYDQTSGLLGRGVIVMGMGVLTKNPVRLPQAFRGVVGESRRQDFDTFGSIMERTFQLKNRIARVLVNSTGTWAERWATLEPETKRLQRFLSSFPENTLVDTGGTVYKTKENSFAARENLPFNLGENVDYILRLSSTRAGWMAECADLLTPVYWTEGLRLRVRNWSSRWRMRGS